MANVPRRLWIAVAAGLVLVLALVAFGLVLLAQEDDVALQVDTWVLSTDELDRQLSDITGNVLYVQAREAQQRPIPVPAEGEPWDPALVAEVLNDNLQFRLAAQALGARGGSVTAVDREAGYEQLASVLTGRARLSADGEGSVDTLDVVLGQFGATRSLYEEGAATIAALRRVLATELGLPIDDVAVGDRMAEVLRETARSARIEVAPDLGRWDPEAVRIVALSTSEGELEPLEPGESLDGTTPPAPDDPSASSTTVAPGEPSAPGAPPSSPAPAPAEPSASLAPSAGPPSAGP